MSTKYPIKELGFKMQRQRISEGLTLRQLSAISGLSFGYLSDLENERINTPSALAVLKLAKALDVTMEYLTNDSVEAIDL